MTLTLKTLMAVLMLGVTVPAASAAQKQAAPRPSGHFCIDTQMPDGRTVPVCRCYGVIDCRKVMPACSRALLASDPDAERMGRCARKTAQSR
jgi:hypothetical protein